MEQSAYFSNVLGKRLQQQALPRPAAKYFYSLFQIEIRLNIELIILIVGSLSVGTWIAYRFTQSPHYLKDRIVDRDNQIKDLKHQINVIRGQYYRMKRGGVIDSDLAKETTISGDFSSTIPALLNAASNSLPRPLGRLARDKNIQNFLVKLANDNPDAAKNFLSRLVPQITSQQEEIPKGL